MIESGVEAILFSGQRLGYQNISWNSIIVRVPSSIYQLVCNVQQHLVEVFKGFQVQLVDLDCAVCTVLGAWHTELSSLQDG